MQIEKKLKEREWVSHQKSAAADSKKKKKKEGAVQQKETTKLNYFIFTIPLSLSLSILRCLWFCCVVGSACRPGRSPARWLRTEPRWESWLCNPRLRSSAVPHSPRESGPAPGNARSRSMSTTRRPPWTERREGEKQSGRWALNSTFSLNSWWIHKVHLLPSPHISPVISHCSLLLHPNGHPSY